MTKTLQPLARFLPLLAFVALALTVAPVAEAGGISWPDILGSGVVTDEVSTSSCLQAQLWATRNEGLLPKDYESFVALPLSHRKAAYRTFTAPERYQLWQEQWLEALQQKSLTDDQTDVLLEAIQLMTPETFEALGAKEGWRYEQAMEQVRSFETRALAAFGRDGTRELFSQIGSVASRQVVLVDPDAPRRATAPQVFAEACSCSQSSDWCPDGYGCGGDSDGCTTIEDECGTFWVYDCNGECLGSPTIQ
jgi:hypothetical protein